MLSVHSVRWRLDATALRSWRVLHDVEMKRFASRCGWSHSYQSKLETGEVESLHEDAAQSIRDAMKYFERRVEKSS